MTPMQQAHPAWAEQQRSQLMRPQLTVKGRSFSQWRMMRVITRTSSGHLTSCHASSGKLRHLWTSETTTKACAFVKNWSTSSIHVKTLKPRSEWTTPNRSGDGQTLERAVCHVQPSLTPQQTLKMRMETATRFLAKWTLSNSINGSRTTCRGYHSLTPSMSSRIIGT